MRFDGFNNELQLGFKYPDPKYTDEIKALAKARNIRIIEIPHENDAPTLREFIIKALEN